jgi:hypothetical protein
MKILRFTLIIILITSISCRKRELDNPFDDWFQDPPVAPITQTIKTVVPIGYAASLVISDMKGKKFDNVKSEKRKSSNVLYVDTETNYPYKFKGDEYGQMVIAYVETGLNTALVSVFFTDMNISTGSLNLKNVIAFPVVYDEIFNTITAIFLSMDINLGDNTNPILDLTSDQIAENMLKKNNKASYYTDISIAQNAWIIEIDPGNFSDLTDDVFTIFGGQQAVEVEDYDTESSAGVLQMAMVDVEFSSDCIKNPTDGFVFMQDVEVATSSNDNDIVFGHVFYEFTPDCDGRILVDIATGNFIFAIGKELDLGLN